MTELETLVSNRDYWQTKLAEAQAALNTANKQIAEYKTRNAEPLQSRCDVLLCKNKPVGHYSYRPYCAEHMAMWKQHDNFYGATAESKSKLPVTDTSEDGPEPEMTKIRAGLYHVALPFCVPSDYTIIKHRSQWFVLKGHEQEFDLMTLESATGFTALNYAVKWLNDKFNL